MTGQKGNRSHWMWLLAALLVMAASPVYALGIGVDRTPVPPGCVLNDGTGVEQYDWEIQFDSTPDHYVEILLDPDGELIDCVYHDLIGWNASPAAPWDICWYSDESATWPQVSPVTGFNSWLAPATAKLGRYEIRIQYFSVEVGEQWEAEGAVTFYVCQAMGSMSLSKWHDLNANGVRDHGEPGIPFWKLSFTDPFGSTFNRLTDANGNVVEESMPIGHYTVWETLKPGWLNATPALVSTSVATGKETKVSFGNYETGSIGDFVWLDANRDGLQDAGEVGIPDVTLALWLDSNEDGEYDTLVATEMTDENGWYLFDELPPGTYRVNVDEGTLPAGAYVLTTGNEPFPYELAPEEEMLEADFGYFKCGVEKCNAIDDDCDGDVDEDFPEGEACDGADADGCKNGTWTCSEDGWGVECLNETVTDIAEICDGVDNDCDGEVDEDFPLSDACDGTDSDHCPTGTYTCKPDGSGVECVNEANPNIEEVCDGADNDCDGEIDEDFELLGQACDSGDSDLCANGHYECFPPSFCRDPSGCNQPTYECVNDFPMDIVEICDGLDNDCDGVVDEGLGSTTCGIGACEATVDNCVAGEVQSCQPGQPIAEVCDLVDNDCDGLVDEGLGTTSCGAGVCAMTVESCVDGEVQSCVPGTPGEEVCDLADNDCDGEVDEGLGTTTCGVGTCEVTVGNCVNGIVPTCVPGVPGVEICDGLDNDCDGAVDEGLGSTTCGVGACVVTVENCVAGAEQSCVPTAPGEEVCDGIDNDCDGAVDEGLGFTTCGVGACSVTVENCVAGEVVSCEPGLPEAEVCDRLDNDCDGEIDEGLGVTSCGTGACEATVDNCVNGVVPECVPGVPVAEVCDLVDNDCDGEVDEGLGTTTCGIGACEATVDNCVAGEVQTCVPGDALVEVCDLVDNDCDGEIDEALGTTTCGIGACEATVDNCVDGEVKTCVPGDAAAEVCDLVDNDCDGEIDEALGTTTCGVGACQATVDNCVGGEVQTCVPGDAVAEACDLVDNDCDGEIDEDLGSTTCGVGLCEVTVENCVGGELQACEPGVSGSEICDGLDNDCDGSVDEELGTSTCGQGICQATVENCVDGQVQICTPGNSAAEVCDGLDNDCDGIVDNDLGTTTCGVGACKVTVANCVEGVAHACVPGTPGEEVCGNLVDEDCDGMLNEGCDSGDDCELPEGCVGLAEAFARGWILIDESGSANASVDVYNFGSAPVCFDDFLLLLSDPTQSLSTDVDTADGQAIEVAPGGKVTLRYGPWTFANGSHQPHLNQPPWWCVEEGQMSTTGTLFTFFGEATPAAIAALIDGETDLDNDGKEDHVDWAGSYGTQVLYNIWAYQSGHAVLTAGKTAYASDPGTVGVVLSSHNIGAVAGSGVLADTLAAGYAADSFSVAPDSMVVNPDGSTTLLWDIELAGFEDMPGTGTSTVFDVVEITYNLYPALDANGARLVLDKATVSFNDGEGEQVNESAFVVAVNVDVDGDGYPACDDCIDSDAASFPGAAERCDGLDNDCDDAIDEDFEDLSDSCEAGIGECYRSGEMICAEDGLGTTCSVVAGAPVAEVCDLLDNDCDGSVDEDLGTTTCGIGACVATVDNCVAGAVQTCIPGEPEAEVCDMIDNDCDGELDEELGTTTCGVGECEVTVDNCVPGLVNTVSFAAGLPAQVQMVLTHPGGGFGQSSYFDVTILGDSILAGMYDDYCVNNSQTIAPGATYTADVYSSLDALPEGLVDFPENLDKVNYVLNQGFVGKASADGSLFTYSDVQRAIWALVDDSQSTAGLGPWSQARVDEIVAEADVAGAGYVPECDGFVGVILAPVGNQQVTIAQVTVALVPGACDPNQECVPGTPSEEICDGLDNDCDGEVDEGLGSTTCGVGACEATTDNCIAGVVQTCVPGVPVAEVCDLVDNDCDGSVDEDLGSTTCGVGACVASVENCVAGEIQTCVPGEPVAETCDLVDNDCDGEVDEGLGSTTCGVGACEATTDNCIAGVVQTCVPGVPVAEVCDLVDNDCDGSVDEDLGSTTCGVGACEASVENCVAGEVQTCVPGEPEVEVCDLIDNDCDGELDEDLGTTTCGVGECEVTVDNCTAGTLDLVSFAAGLPAQVQMVLTHPGGGFGQSSYFDVTILGESLLAGMYDDYCVDTAHTIAPGATYTADVFSSFDALPDGLVDFPENLDLVNYILNQGYVGTPSSDGSVFTYSDVQRAIWTLVDDTQSTAGLGPWSQARVDEIVAEAEAMGDGYEPTCDGVIGVILAPVGNQQVTLAQVTVALIPGACDPNQECVPGTPSEEICDGLDNDCDGEIDEDLGTTTCGVGECVVTVDYCVNGEVQACVPATPGFEGTIDGLYPASSVVETEQGTLKNGQPVQAARSNPESALVHEPLDLETSMYSLGFDGFITVEFACPLQNGAGDDLLIYEKTYYGNPSYAFETADVYGWDSQNNDWVYLGQAENQPYEDRPNVPSYFDLGDLDSVTRVMIVNTTDPSGAEATNDAFDVNGIYALHACSTNCDGLDNDCDGDVDEDFGTVTCGLGECEHSVEMCVDGDWQACDAFEGATDEACDLLDNDCDGSVDEGLGTTSCGVGSCAVTVENCVAGELQECVPALPGVELCDLVDNDCDGSVDEDLGTTSCGVGACVATVDNCIGGVLQDCVPGTPTEEACDLVDNDCDGSVDEDLGTTTCGVGECVATVDNCVAGETQTCVAGTPATELCDALDNDCDGSVDEGFQLGESCAIGACGGENLEIWAVSDDNDPLIVATADAVLTGSTLACNFEHDYAGMTEYKAFFVDTVLSINGDFAPTLLYAYGAYDGADWTGMDATLEDMVADGDVGAYDMWDVSAGTPLDLVAGDLDGVDVVVLDAAPDTAANHFVLTEETKQVLRDFQNDGGKLVVSAYIFVYWENYTGYGYELQNTDIADLVGNVLPDITQAAWPTATTLEPSPHGAGETLVTLIGAQPWHKKPADPFFHEFWVLDASPVVSACYSQGEYVCAEDGTAMCNAEVVAPGTELCGDGIDNDCDCEADEGFDSLGNACSVGVGACYATGEYVCSADGLSEVCDAVAGEPVAEVCGDGVDNDCDGQTDEECVCPHTIGYWKNHPGNWPVEELTVGGVLYAQAEAIQVLKNAKAKDATHMLAAQLIGSKLSVLAGGPVDIVPVIDAADDFLVQFPYGSNPQGDDRAYGLALKDQLDGYNNGSGYGFCECEADCDGKACGSDGCGGSCGTCGDGFACNDQYACQCVPAAEICDGIDNDCDGDIDEGLGSTTCGVGACKVTVANCVDGAANGCVPGDASDETCDLVDNDCDGQVDEGLGVTTCGQGVCQVTIETCVDGVLVNCEAGTPQPELCDGLDNDCDGLVDEGLGTTTCGVGACKVTVQNCVNGGWQNCSPSAPGSEVCDGLDNDCDGSVDEGLGTLSCGVGACEVSIAACVDGQTQTCTPGTPGSEVCDDFTDNDCDGAIDEGCDANDDCELPAGCVSLAEAFARDWIVIDTPVSQSSTVVMHNLGPVEVCLDEHLLFLSDPTQSMTNGTEKANGQAMKIAAGGKITLKYGPWTYPNGYYQPYLNAPSWWCVEYGQLATINTYFGYYGEQAPEMVQYYLDNNTDTNGNGKEDHVEWAGKYGTRTLYNVWGYQNSHGVLTAGKVAGAAGPGDIAVVLTSHNLGAFAAQGVLVDTIPADYSVGNFSIEPDGWVENDDGTVTLFWNIDLAGYEDAAGWSTTTIFDSLEISYDLHAPLTEEGKRIELPRAVVNFNDGQHERTGTSALVVAINVDVDGDGLGGCQDCDNGDSKVYPGADELCDGVDNDCDGNLDEGYDGLGVSCSAGTGGCYAEGEYVCSPDGLSVVCDAQAGEPVDELCDDGIDNNCDGDTDEGCVCPHTIGYWKNHAGAWPVDELIVGGVTYTKAEAILILKGANAKDATMMLAAQLIASKLNVFAGGPVDIVPTIDAADAFLLDNPYGSDPQGDDRDYALSLKDQLDAYNNGIGYGICG